MSPTGYTFGIEDGSITTLREYALTCARAFGALVHIRDDATDAPIPDVIEASEYHTKALAEARAMLSEYQSMDDATAEAHAKAAYVAADAAWSTAEQRRRDTLDRYIKIRTQVARWQPPTPDHEGLKRFMLEQIDTCTKWLHEPHERPVCETGPEHRNNKIAKAHRDITYYTAEDAKERARAAERTAWIQTLKASL